MEYSEKWGKDENEAIKLALADLKITEDDMDKVEVKILEESSKGFFGLGSKLAKVRVEMKDSKKKVKEEKKENKPVESKVEIAKDVNEESFEKRIPVDNTESVKFIKGVIEKMGLTVDINAEETDTALYININGKDSGTIIGKRGQTLDSLQYLTRLVAIKENEKYRKVIIDAENYRAKREKTLEDLANRLANKVLKNKRSFKLEPMSPYERKVIHSTLQNNPKVITRSEGEEPYRKVVIDVKK